MRRALWPFVNPWANVAWLLTFGLAWGTLVLLWKFVVVTFRACLWLVVAMFYIPVRLTLHR